MSPTTEAAISPTGKGNAEEDEVAAVSRAAERALQELDAAIARSMELSESSDDPSSAQVCWAADLVGPPYAVGWDSCMQ